MPVQNNVSVTSVEAELFESNGQPTLLGQVVESFLSELDFGPLLSHPAVQKLATVEEGFSVQNEDGEDEQCDEDEHGAVPTVFEDLDGDYVSELVDQADLAGMFESYVNTIDTSKLEGRLAVKAVADALGEGQVEEGFAKGSFRKFRAAGAGAKVNAMLGAMMKKGVITRAKKPGKGYKGGDYTKAPGGYGGGTKTGLAKYKKFKKAASAKLKRSKAGRRADDAKTKRFKKVKNESYVIAPLSDSKLLAVVNELAQGANVTESKTPAFTNVLNEGAGYARTALARMTPAASK